jgi:hypothetical protein
VAVPRARSGREEGNLEMKRTTLAIGLAATLAFTSCAGMTDTQQRTLSGGAGGARRRCDHRRTGRRRRTRRRDRRRGRRVGRVPVREAQGRRAARVRAGLRAGTFAALSPARAGSTPGSAA